MKSIKVIFIFLFFPLFSLSVKADTQDCTEAKTANTVLNHAIESLARKNKLSDPDFSKAVSDMRKGYDNYVSRFQCTLFASEPDNDSPNGQFGIVLNSTKNLPIEKRVNAPNSYLFLAVGGVKAVNNAHERKGKFCYLVKYTNSRGESLKHFGGVRMEYVGNIQFPNSDDSCI